MSTSVVVGVGSRSSGPLPAVRTICTHRTGVALGTRWSLWLVGAIGVGAGQAARSARPGGAACSSGAATAARAAPAAWRARDDCVSAVGVAHPSLDRACQNGWKSRATIRCDRRPSQRCVFENRIKNDPASVFILDHIEHKYACPCCSKQGAPQFVAARKPEQPLGKGSPGAGLLAHILVTKYYDHMPLYRQEPMFERQGLELSRSTTTSTGR